MFSGLPGREPGREPGGEPRREMTVVSTGGARIHTEIHGPAQGHPTVVLAHGWTCNVTFWEPVLARLAEDHRLVLYDQRGHGRTPPTPGCCSTEALADDLCAVLAATVPPGERAVVCGHSMGGMTIMAAAGRPELRERAAAVLLCSTGADRLVGDSTVLRLRAGGFRSALQRRWMRTRLPYGPVTPLSQRIVAAITLGPAGRADAELRAWTARLVQACPPRARAEWGGVLAGLDVAARLPLLDMPVTVLHGTADRLTPFGHARRLMRRLPEGAVLRELVGVGHMTPLEEPGAVADTVRSLAAVHLGQPGQPGEPGQTGQMRQPKLPGQASAEAQPREAQPREAPPREAQA